MPTVVECPSCQRKLRVPDDLLGKTVQCPSCGRKFEAAGSNPGATSPSEAGGTPTEERVSTIPAAAPSSEPAIRAELPPPAQKDDLEPCPFCGQPVRKDAQRCIHCGEELEEEVPPWERPGALRRDVAPHRGTMILVFGIISLVSLLGCLVCSLSSIVGLGLGIPAWAMGQRDLRRMKRNQMDPSGRGMTQAGWICGMIGTILNSIGLLLTIALIVIYGSLFFFAATSSATKPSAPPVKRKLLTDEQSLPRWQNRNQLPPFSFPNSRLGTR